MSSDSPAAKLILYVASDGNVRYTDTTFRDVPEVDGIVQINFHAADGLEEFSPYRVTGVQELATVDEMWQYISDKKLLSAEAVAEEKDILSGAMYEGLLTNNPSACVLATMVPQ